ncbi:DUF6602 domain-containing protein [Achromobacter sp. GD03932]|uniref:DUF6602 domain-containing protein n=1 Tax=Achromobacter sp. GD03932 TaxID=2975407 RepID=UPI002448EE08|nr:DUF6602 domain-containing protein [Achromobacter sp. GD03932]MDH1302136.1 hypothetical protein [Achromobacter sp. GD03932]
MTNPFGSNLSRGHRAVWIDQAWDKLDVFLVQEVSPVIKLTEYPGEIISGKIVHTIPQASISQVIISPYNNQHPNSPSPITRHAHFIENLASSIIRETGNISPEDLVTHLESDSRLKGWDSRTIEILIKCMVASNRLHATVKTTGRGRNRKSSVELTLSKGALLVEKARTFAGTFANELAQLSERVRHMISHPGAVGSYRESLLQNLLKRSLPERYHVATGFIHGCPRQLDILIYDKIEYPVLFREGDLVVVPPASVRAVIEVKTNLGKSELWSSLEQIAQVSSFDTPGRPFFKGIFAFESGLSDDTLLKHLHSFYSDSIDDNISAIPDFDENQPHIVHPGFGSISQPYQHLTSLCILDLLYAYIDYEKSSKGRYEAAIWNLTSATKLKAQAAHFVDQLLAYLNIGQSPNLHNYHYRRSLGADTIITKFCDITAKYSYAWGAYFAEEQGIDGGLEDREEMEKRINETQLWLKM